MLKAGCTVASLLYLWVMRMAGGGRRIIKWYVMWQMMVALLHSDGQLRTERDGDTEKGCQKSAVQQKTTDDGIRRESSLYCSSLSKHMVSCSTKCCPVSLWPKVKADVSPTYTNGALLRQTSLSFHSDKTINHRLTPSKKGNINNNNNNNTSICKAHNVSIRAESEALKGGLLPLQEADPPFLCASSPWQAVIQWFISYCSQRLF